MIDPAAQLELHTQLLAGDPTASARIAEALFEPLVEKLSRRFPRVDPELVPTAAIDAWASYVKAPEKFDSSKRSLLGYLAMAGEGDLLNALDRLKREKKRLRALEELPAVEIRRVHRNRKTSAEEDPLARLEALESQKRVDAIYQRLDELFPETTDRQLVELVLAEERKTDTYARVLGLQHLPKQEQRDEVKRHKDRIKKRLQRYGQERNR